MVPRLDLLRTVLRKNEVKGGGGRLGAAPFQEVTTIVLYGKQLQLEILLAFLAAAVGAVSLAAGQTAERRETLPEPVLEGGLASLEELCCVFVERLNRGDRNGLAALAIGAKEFADLVFPHLPAARPGSNLTPEFLWAQTEMRSRIGLDDTLRYAGRGFVFLGVSVGDVEILGACRLFREVRLDLQDAAGRRIRQRLFGSVLECGGRYKLYSFVH